MVYATLASSSTRRLDPSERVVARPAEGRQKEFSLDDSLGLAQRGRRGERAKP